ncbi:Aspartyl aminopeptidase [Thermosyntropha lipolytica DSM 11003]|uniref:M18 family aminopeptidase n=1 Tax=Thermosyntropha lipolytica DSM 11003 TaxID=1123382 RepID=A0A1M5QWN6_9FIRM|nr:aminopeptidase [Thermosyntropha lipolytica]SHH18502.1 Aspartyl aminopeptidase [Thermosyntropha lipolytica DSM 11003]
MGRESNIIWEKIDKEELGLIENFSQGYVDFLNKAKTERETVDFIVAEAKRAGFEDLTSSEGIKPGQRFYWTEKNKVAALLVIGEKPLVEGINIVVSHIDAPRIDLKPRPLYEEDNMALFKTHYYGGIKKYQWLSIPLALHGVVVKKDGRVIKINIGEGEDDPVFTISDLLPHLAKEQMEKKMAEAVKGEDLNVLIGSRPLIGEEKDKIKRHIMEILQARYDIEEDDFTSAELQLVPAFKAREVGLDRSMIGGYGQDDRVSAYTSLQAVLEVERPKRTALCLFVDKEEIGSTGNTGLQSLIIENLITLLLYKTGKDSYYAVRQTLANSYAISADVNAAIDPNYPEVFEKMNCSFLAGGVVLTKYTGSRGKAESNDANPEFLGKIRKLFDEHKVLWQVGELGKVDIGGGGTVAQYVAYYGMEVVDCGVAVLSMHSPFEIVSKADLYMAYKGYKAFMQAFV